MEFIEFLESYSGALTVIVTVVYVIATIFIYSANKKAANASRAQIAESQRQFDENRRLDVMPYLQFETTNQPGVDYKIGVILSNADYNGGEYLLNLRVKNIGRGTAKDIEYVWTNFTNTYPQKPFVIKALQNGDAQYLQISFTRPKALKDVTTANFELHFKDLLENEYSQKVEFEFEIKNSSVWLKSHTTYPIIPIAKKITTNEE
jgi:hypothetical protein